MTDRVQVVKWESPSKGGTQEDTVPTEINPNEDGLDARALFIQNDTSEDETVQVTRNASGDMVFSDQQVDPITLSEILAQALNVDVILCDDVLAEVLVDDVTANVLIDQ